jgi:hypothetical protein
MSKQSDALRLERERARPALRLFRFAKSRAAKYGEPFEITVEDIEAVWPEDNLCPVYGIPLQQGIKKPTAASPTLDMIDPNGGYVPGNIGVLSSRANALKSNADAATLRRLLAWITREEHGERIQPDSE